MDAHTKLHHTMTTPCYIKYNPVQENEVCLKNETELIER